MTVWSLSIFQNVNAWNCGIQCIVRNNFINSCGYHEIMYNYGVFNKHYFSLKCSILLPAAKQICSGVDGVTAIDKQTLILTIELTHIFVSYRSCTSRCSIQRPFEQSSTLASTQTAEPPSYSVQAPRWFSTVERSSR